MGSTIEINDTLKLTRGQGMPAELVVGERHPFRREGKRLYHLAPTRVFLVEEIDGKWKFRGHALVIEQTIRADKDETTGIFEVRKVYSEEQGRRMSQEEAPAGKSYW